MDIADIFSLKEKVVFINGGVKLSHLAEQKCTA